MAEIDEAVLRTLLGRALELANEDLDGINEAASELAGGEVSLMTAAIRRIRNEVDADGSRRVKQVASLLRRALEIGT